MGDLGKDAKDLLIGKDNSETEPDDFKSELQSAIKEEKISKADGTLLITARETTDKFGALIDKRQIDDVKKIKDDEVYESAEEELEAKKKKEEKKKEQERKRRELLSKTRNATTKKAEKVVDSEKTKAQKEREN